jgi:hypothetical protein
MKPEINLTLEPIEGMFMPLTVENMGGNTCPPFSFVAVSRSPQGYIRPVKFDTAIDMKPGDRFRFDLRINVADTLTLRFDGAVALHHGGQPVPGNLVTFPKR